MIWLAAGGAMVCVMVLAWWAQGWFAPALRRYRAIYTQAVSYTHLTLPTIYSV